MPLTWAEDVAPAQEPPRHDGAVVFATLSAVSGGAGVQSHRLDLGMVNEGKHYRAFIEVMRAGAAQGALAWRVDAKGGAGVQVAAAMVPAVAPGGGVTRLQLHFCYERARASAGASPHLRGGECECEVLLIPEFAAGAGAPGTDAAGGSAAAGAGSDAGGGGGGGAGSQKLILRARVMEKGTGTPVLKAGVECVGREAASDEETEWAGFASSSGDDDDEGVRQHAVAVAATGGDG